jgi:hypothetical protein
MQSSAYQRPANISFLFIALEAAKNGIEAFREAFKLPQADANVKSYYTTHGSLIHELINDIPDSELPPFLQVLVDNNVDLEISSTLGPPIYSAILYQKKATIRFLLINKAKTHDEKRSVLIAAVPLTTTSTPESIAHTMEIIKMLTEEFSVPIDWKDEHGRTALHRAAEQSHLFIINYFLEKGVAILAMPLAAAYRKSSGICDFLRKIPEYTSNINSCQNTILETAYRHFFKIFFYRDISREEFIRNYFKQFLDDACVEFQYVSDPTEKEDFKKFLEKNLQDRVIHDGTVAKFELEQRYTLCLGFLEPKPNEKPGSFYSFSRSKLFDRNIVKEIFSYAHEIPSVASRLK